MTLGRLISLAIYGCENESSCAIPAEERAIKDFALNWLDLTLNQLEDLDLKIRNIPERELLKDITDINGIP